MDSLKQWFTRVVSGQTAIPARAETMKHFDKAIDQIRIIHPALNPEFYGSGERTALLKKRYQNLPERFEEELVRMQKSARYLQQVHHSIMSEPLPANDGIEGRENVIVATLIRQRAFKEEYDLVRTLCLRAMTDLFEDASAVASVIEGQRRGENTLFNGGRISSMEEARKLFSACLGDHGISIPEMSL